MRSNTSRPAFLVLSVGDGTARKSNAASLWGGVVFALGEALLCAWRRAAAAVASGQPCVEERVGKMVAVGEGSMSMATSCACVLVIVKT